MVLHSYVKPVPFTVFQEHLFSVLHLNHDAKVWAFFHIRITFRMRGSEWHRVVAVGTAKTLVQRRKWP